MKRLVQFVAVLAIGLLVVQPALAGLPCVAGANTECAPGCPMAMNGMRPGCPMASQMASGDCPQNCRGHALPQATAPVAAPEKLKLAVSAAPSMLLGSVFMAEPELNLRTPIEARIASPPRYILNRAFRI